MSRLVRTILLIIGWLFIGLGALFTLSVVGMALKESMTFQESMPGFLMFGLPPLAVGAFILLGIREQRKSERGRGPEA